jgi:hypothetical protein
MSIPRVVRQSEKRLCSICSLLALLLCSILSVAQTTVGTGSIVGTATDQSGAVVAAAKVTISNTATGQTIELTTNGAGYFNSGALSPGNYKVTVGSQGFSTISIPTAVQVGNTSTVNAKLTLGQETQTIEVAASQVQVNTEQAEVQGVLNGSQIENLPVNGRNFLDLAQLEPGVQIQDGQNFDPTKAGYSSISFGGRFGRTARINVDGVDVSDETVGTTTSDIPASAIDEFQMSQSSLDLSNDLTSSGAVNVTTKSGTNTLHGEAFEFIRDHSFAANVPGGKDYPFQRNQFGGRVGGPIIKNRLFFFLDGERTKQDAFAPVDLTGTPFAAYTGGFSQPFRENNLLGKADYNFANGTKAFYRYSYFSNSLYATFGSGYSVYDNKDVSRQHTVGYDFNTGSFTHSIRFSYLKFQNVIVDVTTGNPGIPGSNVTPFEVSSSTFFIGPSRLAPQSTPQSNHQIKYDGSKVHGAHTFRYGVSFNHIQGGGFADFYGAAPRISWSADTTPIAGANFTCPGGITGAACVLNYPVQRLRVGNGQGFNTLDPALGFPAGGLGPDNRLGLYVGDSWKIKPNFTLSAGLRYDRDTGRTDSDLPADPAINAAFPGAGNRVKQPNLNFAPQLGIAWDPRANGKTVIRAGIGLFYENVIYNNVLFDRPLRLQTGAFNAITSACLGGNPEPVPVASGSVSPVGICNQPLGAVIPQIQSFWQQVLAGNPLDLKAANPNYIGALLGQGLGSAGNVGLFGPNYRTPRSLQMNVGIQHEIRHGMVFSADYLRNVETHSLLSIDLNQDGSVSSFNLAGAQAAIAATNTHFGCATVDCAIGAGATIADYAGNGLGASIDQGIGCLAALGRPCAFGGKNQNQASFFELQPIGRSEYNALQMKLNQNVTNPVRGIKSMNLQISYSLSRFDNTGGIQATGQPADNDQDFVLQSADNFNPGRYWGPSLMDRTHQISFGGFVNVPAGFQFSLISHFYSPLASSIDAPGFGPAAAGEIFMSDFTGDGTVGDPLPGTHFGSFDRGTNASQLTGLINNYNNNVANKATPAGQMLINNGLMSLAQLQALGGVAPTITTPPAGQVDFNWLRAMDLKVAWSHTFRERFAIQPSVGFYNVANFSNFNLPPNSMNGILSGIGSGSINGTDKQGNNQFRVGNGTGVYSLGAERQIEFGLNFTF